MHKTTDTSKNPKPYQAATDHAEFKQAEAEPLLPVNLLPELDDPLTYDIFNDDPLPSDITRLEKQNKSINKNFTLPASLLANDIFYSPYQWTLKSAVTFTGVGLHSGKKTSVMVSPAPAHHGFKFCRTDVKSNKNNIIPANYLLVSDSSLCTGLSNSDGVKVRTVEHILSALSASGIDNALITLDNEEIPILDGSAAIFMDAIAGVGVRQQKNGLPYHRTYLLVKKPITVANGTKIATLSPADFFDINCEIDYKNPVIGRMHFGNYMNRDFYKDEIMSARTFCLKSDVDKMLAAGLALGGNLDNALVVGEDGILNKGGLRYPQEFARHKFLDIIGDFALSPFRILGRYQSYQGGHHINNLILRALFKNRNNYQLVQLN